MMAASSSGLQRNNALLFLLALLGPAQIAESRLGTAMALEKGTFEAFMKKNDKVLVDFFDGSIEGSQRNDEELQKAAKMARSYDCSVPLAKVDSSREKELAAKFVPNGRYPQLLWFQHGVPTQYHRTLRSAKQIVDFVLALDRDPISEVQSESETLNYNRVLFAQLEKKSAMYKTLEVVAQKHMDTVGVLYMESKKNSVRWLTNDTDLVSSESQQHETSVYTGDATVDTMDRWVRQQLTRSEPIPERQDGDSIAIVGLNFEESVYRPDKDVFLNVYAPWCGFSRKFLPTWENFARLVAGHSHIVVAKLDGDANASPDPEEFKWNEYPSVFFVKAGQRTPFLFKGNRSIANLVAFANKHGSQQISLDEASYVEDGEL